MGMEKAAARPAGQMPHERDAARVVPGEVVVKLTPAARREPGCLEQLLAALAPGCRIKTDVDRFGMALVQVAPSDSERVIDGLRQSDAVEFAEPNFLESGS